MKNNFSRAETSQWRLLVQLLRFVRSPCWCHLKSKSRFKPRKGHNIQKVNNNLKRRYKKISRHGRVYQKEKRTDNENEKFQNYFHWVKNVNIVVCSAKQRPNS